MRRCKKISIDSKNCPKAKNSSQFCWNFFQHWNQFVGQLQRLFVPNEMCRRVRISVLKHEPLLFCPQDGQLVGQEPNPLRHPLGGMVNPTRRRNHADFFRLKFCGQKPLTVVEAQQGFAVSTLVVQDLGEDCRLPNILQTNLNNFQLSIILLSVLFYDWHPAFQTISIKTNLRKT